MITRSTLPPGPVYDRTKLTTGIVHFGLGNFHRAHQAMFLDRLMNEGTAFDWGICGVGVMPSDQRMRDALAAQDNLYTLVLRHADGTLEPRVIGSIHEYLYAPDDPEAVITKLASPATRIVELTVTEGGYNLDHVTGEFNLENPDVAHDLAAAVPRTVFGLVVEGLRRRRETGIRPFTIVSCDNIQGNGNVAARAFIAYATAKEPDLGAWITENVRFPNSMVDRITPVTSDADRALVLDLYGINDRWPVMAEPFIQWVLEDDFTLGRPPLELAGVQLVDDVEPYELMKLRLLNAGHQALAYFGFLAGYHFAHEAAGDTLISSLVRRYMDEEATPTLAPVPGIDLEAYKDELLVRFTNPEIRDTLARLCQDTSNRIPTFLLPVVRRNLELGRSVGLSAAVIASWARYAEGVDEKGNTYDVDDVHSVALTQIARSYATDPLAFIRNEDVFGDLAENLQFVEPYARTLELLHTGGARVALSAIAAEQP